MHYNIINMFPNSLDLPHNPNSTFLSLTQLNSSPKADSLYGLWYQAPRLMVPGYQAPLFLVTGYGAKIVPCSSTTSLGTIVLVPLFLAHHTLGTEHPCFSVNFKIIILYLNSDSCYYQKILNIVLFYYNCDSPSQL